MSKPKPTSGGGNYKAPIIDKAKEVFGENNFTFAEAKTKVSGYNRQIQADLLNSGDLKRVKIKTGAVHYSLVSGEVRFYSESLGLYKFKHENPDGDELTNQVGFEELSFQE
jgi:hypothetical protein